jgi:murein DD-endopeptidase MepM/ murein hydrolase activator NlpD
VTRRLFAALAPLAFLAAAAAVASAQPPSLTVSWRPSAPRVGDVAVLSVPGPGEGASLEGAIGNRPLTFFRDARGYSALVGFDLDVKPGAQAWWVAVRESERPARGARGRLPVRAREFAVQRLTLPGGMVDLDPETERRALAEGRTLQTIYRTITAERLWRGAFVRPVAGDDPGSGFGARRVINNQPRAPHSGTDYAAPRGTPVVAANDGRVALVAEYFFPGRLVVLDHGLGLYTVYFHLDEARVGAGERVARGQPIGAVGSTGRATGPHLHFGVQLGGARIDPERLLVLPGLD